MISRFNIWQVSWSRPWSCSTSDTSPRVLCFQEGGRIPRVPLRIQHWITSHLMTKIHPDTMFFSQRTSLCLAAKPYKPRGSFDAGPWSQELCDRARLRPQTMNLQPPCAEVSSGSCQSQMENTTTSFLLSHNVSWPGAVSPQISIRKELASVGQDSCYEPRLPAAWCGGCAGQAHVAESLHAHSLPGPHACSEPCLGDTSATCIHAVTLLCDRLQTPLPSGISGHLILNGKRACRGKRGWPCSQMSAFRFFC